MTFGQQLVMMLTLMLTSKGVAGVPRAALVVLTATLTQFGLPLEGAAILLGILFKGQNVAFMVGLAFAVACSANFPALLLSIVWRRFNTAGAVSSIVTGATLSVVLILISPTVWVDLLKHPSPLFPLRNPAIVSMTAAFVVGVVVSLATREPSAEAKFDDERLRTYLGVGAV